MCRKKTYTKILRDRIPIPGLLAMNIHSTLGGERNGDREAITLIAGQPLIAVRDLLPSFLV